MILDYSQKQLGEEEQRFFGGSVVVDELIYDKAWYIDTVQGLIKIYCLYSGNDLTHLQQLLENGCDLEMRPDGSLLFSRIVRGNVQLFPPIPNENSN